MPKRVVIIGAGGHAKSIANIIQTCGDEVVGFLDDNLTVGTRILNKEVIGNINDVNNYKDCSFIIGIGDNNTRKKMAEQYSSLKYYTAVHPSAIISEGSKIGEGTAIMANSVVNVSSTIGKHCIINTASVVEHDNTIQDYVHVSPNVALAGTVKIGECTHVGIGATVINNINIASNCIIGAGSVIIKDIEVQGTYVGVPARKIK